MQPLSVGRLSLLAHPPRVWRQTRHRAALLEVVPITRGQVAFYLPRESIGIVSLQRLSNRLAEFGIRAGHGRCNDFGDQGVLRIEMIIKAALRESGLAHEFIEADAVDAAFAEEPRRGSHDCQ